MFRTPHHPQLRGRAREGREGAKKRVGKYVSSAYSPSKLVQPASRGGSCRKFMGRGWHLESVNCRAPEKYNCATTQGESCIAEPKRSFARGKHCGRIMISSSRKTTSVVGLMSFKAHSVQLLRPTVFAKNIAAACISMSKLGGLGENWGRPPPSGPSLEPRLPESQSQSCFWVVV